MDIIYTLGNGSIWDNNELRYSLRSLEHNCKYIDRVFVIGDSCDWFSSEIIHVPFIETKTRAFNVLDKFLYFFKSFDVKDVLYMMDDVFLLEDVYPDTYPFYYKNNLPEIVKNQNNYNNSLIDTRRYLIALGKECKHFGCHVPIVYNKEKFLSIDWSPFYDYPNGLSIRSVYCNVLGIEGKHRRDVKFYDITNVHDLQNRIRGSDCFSIADNVIYNGVSEFLKNRFPQKSRFEK